MRTSRRSEGALSISVALALASPSLLLAGLCRSNLMATVPLRTSNTEHRTPNAERDATRSVAGASAKALVVRVSSVRCSVFGVGRSVFDFVPRIRICQIERRREHDRFVPVARMGRPCPWE